MKANLITNVLLGVLILLVIVCTAVIQQEMRANRQVMQQLLARGPQIAQIPSTPTSEPQTPSEPPPTNTTTTEPTKPAPTPATNATRPAEPTQAPTKPTKPAASAPTEPPQPPAPAHTETPTAPTETTTQEPQPTEAAAAPVDAQWQEHGEQLTGIVRDLLAGQYDPVVKQFNREFAASLSKAQLANVMNGIRDTHGALDHVISHAPLDVVTSANVHATVITAATERGQPLVFTITLDGQGKIAGLYVQ